MSGGIGLAGQPVEAPHAGEWVGMSRPKPAAASRNGPGNDRNRSARPRRERAVLTNRPAKNSAASARGLVRGGAAIVVSAVTLTSVYAGGVGNMSCVGGRGGVNCVEQWGPAGDPNVRAVPPKPLGDEERARAAARERRWLAQCQPEIRRDPYGVARYVYAARGCEYGVGAD
jgi:hypothetical protein